MKRKGKLEVEVEGDLISRYNTVNQYQQGCICLEESLTVKKTLFKSSAELRRKKREILIW